MKRLSILITTILLVCYLPSCNSDSGHKGGRQVASINTANEIVEIHQNSQKPIFNVYVENSGSMYGYVEGVTEFEDNVYNYLSDIHISGITDTLNLFYINSRIIKRGSDIDDFIRRLDPSSFKLKGGNMTQSDIQSNLKMILNETKPNKISVFVSDCIFSPGPNKDANQYLINQQIGLKTLFHNYINRRDVALIIYQLTSKFNGLYYNKVDRPIHINNIRPFYIWVIGSSENILKLRKQVIFNENVVKHEYTICSKKQNINYGILPMPRIGTFERDKNDPKKHIQNIRRETKGTNQGLFMFSIGADFSKLPLDNSYLCNSSNYILNDPDYKIEVLKNNTPSMYSHTLRLKTSIIKSSRISITLKKTQPNWIEEMNDNIGNNINSTGSMSKTFGIKYLIGGVYDAFTANGNDYYTKINIQVN